MGTSTSRDSKVDIDSILKTVNEFHNKVSAEKRISQDVKIQTLWALNFYLRIIEKAPRKKQNKRDTIETKIVILKTIKNLEDTPIYKHEPVKVGSKNNRSVLQMKSYLHEIETKLNTNRIREEEFEDILKNVTTYAKELNRSHYPQMKPHEQDDLSLLFLKLYIKSPSQANHNVLKVLQINLIKILDDFEKWRTKDVTSSELESVIAELEKVTSYADALSQKSTQVINNLTSKQTPKSSKLVNQTRQVRKSQIAASPKPLHNQSQTGSGIDRSLPRSKKDSIVSSTKSTESTFNEIEESLNKLEKFVASFSSQMDDASMHQIKTEIDELINDKLERMQEEGATLKRKKLLHSKGMYIINKLVQTGKDRQSATENMKLLKRLEGEVVAVIESTKSGQDKKYFLEACAESVGQVTANSPDVNATRNFLLNKIEALVMAQTASYLKQTKKILQHHKEYVKQFAFPKQSNFYKKKLEEINSLTLRFSDLLNGNEYVGKRVKNLQDELNTILDILAEKAGKNDEIISTLRYLENAKNELTIIDSSSNPWKTKLRAFNGWRERVSTIDNVHQRITHKKLHFLDFLHSLEHKIYSTKYASNVFKLKATLDLHEKNLQQPQKVRTCQQRKTDVFNLKRTAYDVCQANRTGREETDILIGNFDIVLASFDHIISERTTINKVLEDLKAMERETSSSNLLKRNKAKITAIQKLVNDPDVLSRASIVGTKLDGELQKLRLQEIKSQLERYENDNLAYSIDRNQFQKQAVELFKLYDKLDGISEDNQELQAVKQILMSRICHIFQQIDRHIAQIITEDVKHDNILELRNSFLDLSSKALVRSSAGSADLVQLVIRKAEAFESSIEQYLGNSYSVDYYVIHENLMRLLEELDKVNCNNDEYLLNLTVKAVNYIKSLLSRLEMNAIS